ncbi:WD40 repeat domain-containing protein [bacterium]|nr:MAG: WD40 repeat domain-containing protein [bacterium]
MSSSSLPPLLEHSRALNHLAFRPDGTRLAVGDTAMGVEVREGEHVVWQRSLATPDQKSAPLQRIRGLEFSPDGLILYALATDALYAFDAESGQDLWCYRPPRAFGFLVVSPSSLAVRRDGLVAAAFDNGAIGVWSSDGHCQGLWRDIDVQRHLVFLRDGNLLGDDSFGLSVFDVETGHRLYRTPLRDRAFGLALAPDGNVAVRTLHETWQMNPTGHVFARTTVEPGLPLVEYSPCEPVLALGAAHSVTLVSTDGKVRNRIEVEDTTVISMAFAPDGSLSIGGADGSLRRFDLD